MVGPLPYIGGKHRLAKTIIELFPNHTTYVEAFAGGAQVLFRKEPSAVEVLNDLDGDIVNLFRVCQAHHEELIRCMKFMLASRKWFGTLKAENPDTLTDIQRAARFLYLQKNSFAGLVRRQDYQHAVVAPRPFNPQRLPEILDQAHERLARVQIESLPYEEILKRFDKPETLFYLDPPYFRRKLYRFNFKDDDFVKLADRLRAIKGKFIVSINDVAEIREIFRGFHQREVDLHYTSQKDAGKRYPELLITNFE
jgi:DNA adenine methylase